MQRTITSSAYLSSTPAGDRVLNVREVHLIHLDDEGKVSELRAVTDPKPHLDLWADS